MFPIDLSTIKKKQKNKKNTQKSFRNILKEKKLNTNLMKAKLITAKEHQRIQKIIKHRALLLEPRKDLQLTKKSQQNNGTKRKSSNKPKTNQTTKK